MEIKENEGDITKDEEGKMLEERISEQEKRHQKEKWIVELQKEMEAIAKDGNKKK